MLCMNVGKHPGNTIKNNNHNKRIQINLSYHKEKSKTEEEKKTESSQEKHKEEIESSQFTVYGQKDYIIKSRNSMPKRE